MTPILVTAHPDVPVASAGACYAGTWEGVDADRLVREGGPTVIGWLGSRGISPASRPQAVWRATDMDAARAASHDDPPPAVVGPRP